MQCPTDTAEHGAAPFSEAGTQPDIFTIQEKTLPFTVEEQLSAIFYCTAQNSLYLAGFKFTFGMAEQMEFGDLATVQLAETGVECKTILVTEWITTIQYFWSADQGLLGFQMVGNDGAQYLVKALGTGAFESSPVLPLGGPPIGFRVLFSDSLAAREQTPFAMKVVVNGCACDFSYFLGGEGPRDMNTDAISGVPDTQIVPNQRNFITLVYGQDCGKTIIKINPEYTFLTVTTDEVTGEHSLKLESLKNEIGSYDVKAMLSPDDPFSMISPIIYEFTIFIHPCILEDVVVTPPESISFEIGEPEIVIGYAHQQVPDCQYPIEVFFSTSLPTYMEHDIEGEQVIFPQIDDTSYAGVYVGDMGVRVYIPDDYTYDSGRIETYKNQFQVEIIDPCPASEIVPFSIVDTSVRVFTGSVEQYLPTPQDTVSQNYGTDGISFCGPRLYQFTVPSLPGSSVVQFDKATNTLVFESSNTDEVGTHLVQAIVVLERYPTVRTSATFQLKILPCLITEFTPPEIVDQRYDVFMMAKDILIPQFTQEPACNYDVTYEYEIVVPSESAGPLPSWITQIEADQLSIQTDDIQYLGVYVIRVTASVQETEGQTIPTILEESTTFNLVVGNGCIEDVITPTSFGVESLTQYVIAKDGTKQIDLRFDQKEVGCPIQFDLLAIDAETQDERPLSPEESSIVNFVSDKQVRSSQVSILATDFTLDGTTIKLKVILRSIHSEIQDGSYTIPDPQGGSSASGSAFALAREGGEASYEFKIVLIDPCWLSELSPSQFQFTTRTYDLYQDQMLAFTAMSDLSMGTQCGGFTYELEYINGPAANSGFTEGADFNHYTRDGLSYVGVITDKLWVGTHTIRIKCTNGNSDNISMRDRGENGFFMSVFSDAVTLVIEDPCTVSKVSQVAIQNMNMPKGQTLLTTLVSGPSDSASLKYGNGFDKCGPLSYTTLDSLDQSIAKRTWFDFDVLKLAGLADKLYLNLISEPEGTLHTVDLRLKISLSNYATATPAFVPFTVRYRGCFFDELKTSSIGDQSVRVGNPARYLGYSFNQGDCTFRVFTDVTVYNSDGAVVDEPDFVFAEKGQDRIGVLATQKSHVGDYRIVVVGTLDNVLASQAEITFMLEVKDRTEPEKVYISPTLPAAEVSLYVHNQRVKLGSNLTIEYSPQIKERNTFGYLRTLNLDLGQSKNFIKKFIKYDPLLNLMTIESRNVTEVNLGSYELTFEATYSNSTYDWTEDYVFTLVVYRDPVILVPEKNSTKNETEYWNGTIIEDLTPGKYNSNQPVPRIARVSQTGQVSISWDRPMMIPDDLDQIAMKKLGLRDTVDYSRLGVGTGVARRKLGAETSGKVKLIDALELRIAPKDGDEDSSREIAFKWEVSDFTERELTLQLSIDQPELISVGYQVNQLQITFYDTSLFKEREQETPVRFGTKLIWDLHRMVSDEDVETLDWLKVFYVITLVTLFISIPMLAVGDLLPTWIFIHSLQLIAHTPLLCSAMPGNVQYFLLDYLTVVRVREPDFSDSAPPRQSTEQPEDYDGAYNYRFRENGYTQLLGTNLVVILYIALVLLVLWALAELKDFVVGRFCKQQRRRNLWWAKQHGPMMSNATIRLVYVMFLEILICAGLTLSSPDFSTQQAAGLQWFFALVAIVAACASLIGLIYLCLKKNSPTMVEGFFEPKTWHKSFWQMRPVREEYAPYAVDGKGSDELEDFDLYADSYVSSMDKKMNSSSQGKQLSPKQNEVIDLELPMTDRNLLGDCDDNEIREDDDEEEERKLSPALEDQIMTIIGENQQQVTHRRPIIDNDKMLGVPEQNTGLMTESIGSVVANSIDMTIPQLSRGNDSLSNMDDEMKKQPQIELLEGGESEIIAALKVDQGTDMSRDEDVDRKEKRVLYLRRLARKRLYLADDEAVAPTRYSTLFLGLRKNTERNSAMVHVMAFVTRRVMYALLIVVFASLMLWSTILFLLMTLAVLAIAFHDHQWEHWLINQQHKVNEMITYAIAVLLFTFTGYSGLTNSTLGWAMVSLICIFIVYNAIVVMRFALRTIKVITKTVYVRYIKKRQPVTSSSSQDQAKRLTDGENNDQSKDSDQEQRDLERQLAKEEEERKQREAMIDNEAQTEDFDGLLARFFAWLQGIKLTGSDSSTSGGFFGRSGGNAHEMSFGKRRESEADSAHSSGTFGGAATKNDPRDIHLTDDENRNHQLALKTLDKNLLHPPSSEHRVRKDLAAYMQSPTRSDIFNKSGQNEDTEKGLMSAHRNIPIRLNSRNNSGTVSDAKHMQAVIRELSREDLLSSIHGSSAKKYQHSSSKKRRKSKTSKHLHPTRTADAHLDPKRQINLLEQSGLSEALDANLSAHRASQMRLSDSSESRGERGSAARLTLDAAARKKRPAPILGDEGITTSQGVTSTEQTAYANAKKNILHAKKDKRRKKVSKSKGTNEESQGVRSAKMFDDEQLLQSSAHKSDSNALKHFQESPNDESSSESRIINLDTIKQAAEEEAASSTHLQDSKRKKSKAEIVQKSLDTLASKQLDDDEAGGDGVGGRDEQDGNDGEDGDDQGSDMLGSQDFTGIDNDQSLRTVIKQGSNDSSAVQKKKSKPSSSLGSKRGKRNGKGGLSRNLKKIGTEALTTSKRLSKVKVDQNMSLQDASDGGLTKRGGAMSKSGRGLSPMSKPDKDRSQQRKPKWATLNSAKKSTTSGFNDGRSTVSREPRKRGDLMAPTQASLERIQARENEVKKEKMPPMKYTNQGHSDIIPPYTKQTHDSYEDETTPARRNRTISDTASRLSMSVLRAKTPKKDNEKPSARQNRFKEGTSLNQDGPPITLYDKSGRDGGGATSRSKSSMQKKENLVSKAQNFSSRKNSTDGFKKSSTQFKRTTANTKKSVGKATAVNGGNTTVAPFKGLQTDSELELNAIFDKYSDPDPKVNDLQKAIDSAERVAENASVLNPDDQSQVKIQIKTGKNTARGSILSDWDDITIVSGIDQNYYKAKKNTTPRKMGKSDLLTKLKQRYGIKNKDMKGDRSKSGTCSSRVSSTGKRKSYITPGFNPEDSLMSVLKQDVEPIPETITVREGNASTLGVRKGANTDRHTKSQMSLASRRSGSSSIRGDMVVPVSTDGSVLQFAGGSRTSDRRKLNNRHASGIDFSVYADAFGFEASQRHKNKARYLSKKVSTVTGAPNQDNHDIVEFYNNTYIGCANLDKGATPMDGISHAESKMALESFLNEMPDNENGSPSSAIKGSNINFQLGGDGTMAQGGHQQLQNRLSQIKQSKLFQTVMDTRKDLNQNASIDGGSFTQSILRNTPYQSKKPQDSMTPYNKRISTTGLRLHQNKSSCGVIPDETSEGNRQDLLNHLFFPGGHSRMHGSSSVRSASLGSQGSVPTSNQVNMGLSKNYKNGSLTSRLGANKAAGISIISGGLNKTLSKDGSGCKNKRYCSISDISSQGL